MMVFHCCFQKMSYRQFLSGWSGEVNYEELANSLLISGLAMGFSGDSSPCSGSEHLISHAIDYMQISNSLHGEQVAVATLFVDEYRKLNGFTKY